MRVSESNHVVETADTVSYSSLLDLQVATASPSVPASRYFALCTQGILGCPLFTQVARPPHRGLPRSLAPSLPQYMPNHVLEHLDKISFTDMEQT